MAEKSKVFFADFRCPSWRENLPQKLARLIMTAGFGDLDLEDKYVAIKMHFGEPGNLAYLRPNWAKVVADLVKDKGGKPFLTDCNTLYVGGRKNALDHIESAYVNGFTPYSTGCHILIADGLKGNDEVESLVFSHCLQHKMSKLVELYRGELIPSRAFADGGIHEAIENYEDVVFYEILAEELALRDMDGEPLTRENYTQLMDRIDAYLSEFDQHGTDNISVDMDE